MAGFEVIVRPVVFPNIRPAPPRILAPPDNPDQSIVVLSGSGGKLIDLPRNWSVSVSQQRPQHETKRQFNIERVYQKDDNGAINKSNFVDLERLKKIEYQREEGDPIRQTYASPPKVDNVETLETDVERSAPPSDGGES